MYKLTALWGSPKPEDRAAFEDHYLKIHVPLANALKNLSEVQTVVVDEGLEGAPQPFHRVAIMVWPDRAAFARDEASEAWKALRADGSGLAERFGVSLIAATGEDG